MADLKDTIFTTARMAVNLKEDTDRILSYARAAMGLADFLEEGVHYIDAYIDNIKKELVFVNFDNIEKRYKLQVFSDDLYVHGDGEDTNKLVLSKSLTSYSEGLIPVSSTQWKYNINLTTEDAVLVTNFTWSDGSSANSNFQTTRTNGGKTLNINLSTTPVKTDCSYFNINIKASTPGKSDYTDKINMNVPNPYYYGYNISYSAPITGTGKTSAPVKLNYNSKHFSVVGNQLNIKNYLKYYMGPVYWESSTIITLHLLGMTSSTIDGDKIVLQNPYSGHVMATLEPTIDGDSQQIDISGVTIDTDLDFILIYAENVNHKMVSDALVIPVYKG